jgi:hypothetical protein
VSAIQPVFEPDAGARAAALEKAEGLLASVQRARRAAAGDPPRREAVRDSLRGRHPLPGLRREHWDEVLSGPEDFGNGASDRFAPTLKRALRDVLDAGILSLGKQEIRSADGSVRVLRNGAEAPVPLASLYDLEGATARVRAVLARFFPDREALVRFGAAAAETSLRPTLLVDPVSYRARVREAMARVPLSSGFVYENEKIVDRNERITPEIRQKLVSLSAKMSEKGMRESGPARLAPAAGRAVFVLSLLAVFAVAVYVEDRSLLARIKPVFLFALVFCFVGGAAALLRRIETPDLLVPAAAGAMLLASMFDRAIGFAAAAVLSVLVGGVWGNSFSLTAVSLFTGVAGVVVIKRVRSRSQLVGAVLFMTGATVFSATAMGFLGFSPFREVFGQWQYAVLSGLFTPILAYGLLALFESAFDITTDFSLLELSNLNHPLLKRLSVEAPGTYHHSILVGNLAEAAATAVGAHSLLARVGSYYHDIGKVEKAEYFVENQVRGKNPHRKLTPRMSALILANHVKKSLELAERHRLPQAIRDIMTQHHGRSVMDFFFQKAVSLKAGDEDVNEEDYRYPGPKPQSKEAAIVMLADAVEAASRALRQPTYSRLKGLIENLVDKRFQAGELDESPLTLRDLQRIKDAFLVILAGTFHARVEYPDNAPRPPQTTNGGAHADGSPGAAAGPAETPASAHE